MNRLSLIVSFCALAACNGSPMNSVDPGLEALSLETVEPSSIVAGSTLVITGRSFITDDWGDARLIIDDTPVPLRFVDFNRYEADITAQLLAKLKGDTSRSALIEIDSRADGQLHKSNRIDLSLKVNEQLEPRLSEVAIGGLSYVNEQIEVSGGNLLLGGDEGQTLAIVSGCFTLEGESACVPVDTVEIPVTPSGTFDRDHGSFPFAPSIAGIQPGNFDGSVSLRNVHGAGEVVEGQQAQDLITEITKPALFSVSTQAASLGQYVDAQGGGFVGGTDDGVTEAVFEGTFTPDHRPDESFKMDFSIIPTFESGDHIRYVLNEDDQLGQIVDLRQFTGLFEGTITPIVHYGADQVTGLGTDFRFRVDPVKQIVYLKFLPSFVSTLRFFGLRAMESQIRDRIVHVTHRDFATINAEFRTEEPTDFELFETVEIAGWNPNCREVERCATLGLDNTPGKDVGNLRLHDYLGVADNGDGLGYGGVFIQAMFGFSEHPHDLSADVPAVATPLFDEIFDPFRPDEDGTPVTSADFLAGPIQALTSDPGCPLATTRREQIQCAVWALGNLAGTTISHEVGHSLGLASPYGSSTQYHLYSDEDNRLMDNGGDRPFQERAQLLGEGPGVFCQGHYDYLREILPTGEPRDETTTRPSCF